MSRYRLQIVKAESQNDIDIIVDPSDSIAALDIIRDLKDSADDGWRLIIMRIGQVSSEEDIESYTLREDSKAELHVQSQNSFSVNQYNTLAEAISVIDSLNTSDGFLLIDEGADSLIVYERPTLWKTADISDNGMAHYRKNSHGRTGDDII